MSIPNLWPDGKSRHLSRALNNIALHRLCPGLTGFENGKLIPAYGVRRYFPNSPMGENEPVMLFFQARKGDHYIMLHQDWVDAIVEVKARGSDAGLLALCCDPKATTGPIHTWLIPAEVVKEMGSALPNLKQFKSKDEAKANLRNIRISSGDGTDRWTWTGAHASRKFDVTDYYQAWSDLSEEELAHIREGVEGKLGGPEGHEAEAVPFSISSLKGDDSDRAVSAAAAMPVPGLNSTTLPAVKNLLFFGPPGVGKSWHVDRLTTAGGSIGTFRVTFHPEYSYADFVGTYRPVMAYGRGAAYTREDGKPLPAGRPAVIYSFVPGPFTLALTKALASPDQPVFLVIEEVNRGNCAAIFGDVFQLLDRTDDGGDEWGGSSRYPIRVDAAWGQHVLAGGVTEAAAERLRDRGLFLPGNLFLLGTMNTSDQSLFPLDAAFKRRWQMRYVPIEYDQAAGRRVAVVGGETPVFVSWADFLREMNGRIARELRSDDKQMGQWFVSDREVAPGVFRDKVLFYLWSDVFRHSPGSVFDADIDTYDTLVREFDDGQWVFDDTFAADLGVAAELGLPGGQPVMDLGTPSNMVGGGT